LECGSGAAGSSEAAMSEKRTMWAVCVWLGSEGHLPPMAVCWTKERAERLVETVNLNPGASMMHIREVEIIEP
jgi:hypothetical protein